MSRPAIQQFAGHYIRNMAFSVVLLLAQAKRPRDDGWPQRYYDVNDFEPEHNIGIKTVNGLAIVDDDFETPALACANDFLPETGASYGHGPNPQAKRLFQCLDLTAPIAWKNLDGKTLRECYSHAVASVRREILNEVPAAMLESKPTIHISS